MEGVALLKGGKNPELGQAFMAFLRSSAVQADIQTTLWMRPIIANTPIHPVLQTHAQVPTGGQLYTAFMGAKSKVWLAAWGELFLR